MVMEPKELKRRAKQLLSRLTDLSNYPDSDDEGMGSFGATRPDSLSRPGEATKSRTEPLTNFLLVSIAWN